MRIAVISDVHGNLYALEAVLGEIDRTPPDEIWCLGDTVGYGPRPNECCALVRERCSLALVGNHDLVALGSSDVGVEDFNPEAGAASVWTAKELSPESREFLSPLEPKAVRDGFELFHGSPRDPVWDYVLDEHAAADSFERTEAAVLLVGHSHVAMAIASNEDGLDGRAVPDGHELDLNPGRRLLNPGSVGQPRDSDPRASWLDLDLDAGQARFHRIAYPVARTQAEIRERGLPDSLAERLAHGV